MPPIVVYAGLLALVLAGGAFLLARLSWNYPLPSDTRYPWYGYLLIVLGITSAIVLPRYDAARDAAAKAKATPRPEVPTVVFSAKPTPAHRPVATEPPIGLGKDTWHDPYDAYPYTEPGFDPTDSSTWPEVYDIDGMECFYDETNDCFTDAEGWSWVYDP